MRNIIRAHFAGSIGRFEYLLRLGCYVALSICASALIDFRIDSEEPLSINLFTLNNMMAIATAIYGIILLLGSVLQRLTDAGRTRFWALLLLFPYAGILFVPPLFLLLRSKPKA
jgi:uncharacterized membrane protein YhaH (DUF805 family)